MSSLPFASSAIAALCLSAGAAWAQCTVYRLDMPDFDQRRSVLPSNGGMYCVPTATANALAYIANHGYASAFSGPRDWSSQANYGYVSGQILGLGLGMGTDPVDGTTMDGWFDATQPRASALGYFGVSWFGAIGFSGLSPKTLADQMRIGAVVLPLMGWYDNMGGGRWKRDGGHMVTMWGAFNTCAAPADMVVVYRDPANDRELDDQGPFTTTPTQFAYLPGSTFSMKSESGYFPRIVYQLTANGGFLDGYGAIWPIFGLTTGPSLEDISFYVPQPTTDQPGPKRFDTPITTGRLLALAHSAIPTEGYALTVDSTGRLGTLLAINYADRAAAPVGSMLSPNSLVIGRDGFVYISAASRLDRYGPQAGGAFGLINSLPLPNRADALFYDDATDEIVAMNIANRRLMRITKTMSIRRDDVIPAAAAVLGDGSVAVNPVDGKEWIAGSDTASLVRLGRDAATGRLLPEALVSLPGVTSPRSLQFGDDGTLYVHARNAIKAFVPDGAGGWRIDLRNPLHDSATGPVFTVGRSRTNYDPATMEDINVLPPDIGLGDPDCRADLNKDGRLDFFDFLEFQNLFARGSTAADFNFDGRLDFFDFLEFQNEFAAGCR
ncbi:MAG: GC-type dockerin domain-anchored protein [Phycisphaerales bacterium JB039]